MKTITLISIFFALPIISLTQPMIEKIDGTGEIQRNNKKEISYYKPINNETALSNRADFFSKILNKSTNDEFKLLKKGESKNGKIYEEYRQYFNDVPVKSGVFVLHMKDGLIESANGNYIRVGELNAAPSLTEVEAMENWCKYLNIPFEDVGTYKSELLIVDVTENDENAKESQPVLAYKMRLYSKNPLNKLIGFIDARSGNVCLTEPLAITSSAPAVNSTENPLPATVPSPVPDAGIFITRYSGWQSGVSEYRNNLYYLEDWLRGDGIETRNLEDSDAAVTAGAASFTDDDNYWEEYHNGNYDDAALDVHWALQKTYDFFEDEYYRSGWDSAGQKINAYVHAIIVGSRDNAHIIQANI